MAEPDASPSFERFPALARLGERLRRRRIPFVGQLAARGLWGGVPGHGAGLLGPEGAWTRCAAPPGVSAHGRQRPRHAGGRRGTSACGARGVKVDMDQLHLLEPGTILHWEFRHFVVFERLARDGVDVVDPASAAAASPWSSSARPSPAWRCCSSPPRPSRRRAAPRARSRRYCELLLERAPCLCGCWSMSLLLQLFALALPVADRAGGGPGGAPRGRAPAGGAGRGPGRAGALPVPVDARARAPAAAPAHAPGRAPDAGLPGPPGATCPSPSSSCAPRAI